MKKMVSVYQFLIVGILAIGAAGCDIPRPPGSAGDIEEFAPPAATPITAAPVPAREEIAQTETIIRLEPAASQLEMGGATTIEIRIDNAANLYGADIELQFASNILQIQDANSGQDGVQIQPGDFPKPDFIITNLVDNTAGAIRYALTQRAPTEPVSGNGLLARFTLQAIAQGQSNLTFAVAKLASPDGLPILVTTQPGQVTVGQVTGELTPTVTATTVATTTTPTSTPDAEQPTPSATSIPDAPGPLETPTSTPPIIITVAPTATPPPTYTPLPLADIPPGATVGFCYRVQKGETLHSLAERFGFSPGYINLVNDLHPPGYIYPQQVLFMPEQQGNGPNVYIVKPGDTLASIAEQCSLPISALVFANRKNGVNEGTILQGNQVLLIPRPPFPPPSRYPYPPSGPYGPPSVYPPPGAYPPAPCCIWR